MENFSAWSIKNPIPAIVTFLLLTFAGVIGFKKLGINQYPDVDVPVVSVSVSRRWRGPGRAGAQVTRIVENSVATVGDVAHGMSSVSDGTS